MGFWIKIVVLVVVVFGLSWIPLVGAYDYESAWVTALLGVVFVPLFVSLPRESGRDGGWIVRGVFGVAIYWGVCNAIWVGMAWLRDTWCDPLRGFEYQVLIALMSNALSGFVWTWLGGVSRLRIVRVTGYVACVVLDVGFALYALYEWPPIVAFGQFFGYFAGSIYDESIDVMRGLVFFRASTLVLLATLILAQTAKASRVRRYVMPVLGLLLAFGVHVGLAHEGVLVPMGRDALRATLWATAESEDGMFRVHFVPRSRATMRAERARHLLELNRDVRALEAFFDARPVAPVDIWVYPNREMKGRFMGARNTSFARVWKHEVHLVESSPDSTLARHELAHLFAASFGNAPLGLAGGAHVPAPGWIEGLAMAAEWPVSTFDLHTWSAAILNHPERFGEITPVGLIYGFWGMPSRVAYTLAGSYVRWLVETYGIARVKSLSRVMPGSFEAIVGVDIHATFDAWRAHLRDEHSDARADRTVALAFGTSSIWTKRCARQRASEERGFYACLDDPGCDVARLDVGALSIGETCEGGADDMGVALARLERVWALYMAFGVALRADAVEVFSWPWPESLRGTVGEGIRRARGEASGGAPRDGVLDIGAARYRRDMLGALDGIMSVENSPQVRRVWQERAADMYWHAKFGTVAWLMYSAVLSQPLVEVQARRVEIKRQAARHADHPVSREVLRYFSGDADFSIESASLRHPGAPVLAYLDFVDAMHRREFGRAERALARCVWGLPRANGATRLPARAWRELWRLAAYL